MVERAVRIVYTHVYAPLRNHHFTSLAQLNTSVQEQLILLNNKPYKNTPYSLRYSFDQQEKALLKELPCEPFTPKKVVQLPVQRNYHVQLSEDHRYYSVPYQYVGKKSQGVLYQPRSRSLPGPRTDSLAYPQYTSKGIYYTWGTYAPSSSTYAADQRL